PIINTNDALYRYWCTMQSPDYFPFIHTVFWIEWKLWGPSNIGWHLFSIFLHALTAVLAWVVMQRLRFPGAWLSALIFAVHPVNVEAAGWVYQQRTILPMTLMFVSILAYLKFEKENFRLWYAVSLLTFLLALLSKISVMMLPAVFLLVIWWQCGKVQRHDIMRMLPFFALAVIFGLLTSYVQAHRNIGEDIVRTDSFLARLAGAGLVVWFYIYKDLLPVNLIFIYPKWEINTMSIVSWLPLAALIASFVFFWQYRKSWGRQFLVALGYFVLMLFPVLGFVNIYFMRYSLVADHWQYSAMLGIVALIVGGIYRIMERRGIIRQGVFVAVPVIITLVFLSWNQQRIYKDEETLWRSTLAKNPNAWSAHVNLGVALAKKGKNSEAISHYKAAIRISPTCPEAYNSLAAALIQEGQYDEALEHLSKALSLKPKSARVHYNLGRVYAAQGRLHEAAAEYAKSFELNPYFAEAYTNFGAVLIDLGRTDEALEYHLRAVNLNPNLPEAHNNLGVALAVMNRLEEAECEFREAIRLDPNYEAARRNLNRILTERKEVQQ
ncbi:MAG: tetratricopeptide repeat protein, partial [Armatimonadota bacterium]|nr:tetratricopeptide repeat protein [Armatimonadota bacterium]